MGIRSTYRRLEHKDQFVIALTIVTIALSVSALATSIKSCSSSEKSTSISQEALDLARSESRGSYSTSFEIVWKEPNGGTVFSDITDPNRDDYVLPLQTLRDDETWLRIKVANTGNRPVTIYDVGLLSDTEARLGNWIRNRAFTFPSYCAKETDGDRDIRCFNFPVNIPAGSQYVFQWPVFEDVQFLVDNDAAKPIVVAINSGSGDKTYETNLAMGW